MHLRPYIRQPAAVVTVIATLVACQATAPAVEQRAMAISEPNSVAQIARVADLKGLPTLGAVIPRLAEKQVVFVGETHDQFGHHLAQLEIIRGLHAIHDDLVIGMEYFQVPFQKALDAYIGGEATEKEMLKQTEYFERWRFDYRLYRPILQYAREHNIPLIALNIPAEINRQVARSGIESLSAAQRAQIPQDIDRSDEAYRERLRAVFEEHRERDDAPGDFDDFVDSQLLWDEGMAETAAKYLRAHPERRMVILAGSGHLLYGSGIPRRLLRRVPMDSAIVINAGVGVTDPQIADFLLFPTQTTLPPAGLLGVFLKQSDDNVVIEDVADDGAAKRAGLQKGDWLLALDGVQMASIADVKIALLDKTAGEKVRVRVKRGEDDAAAQVIELDIALMASH